MKKCTKSKKGKKSFSSEEDLPKGHRDRGRNRRKRLSETSQRGSEEDHSRWRQGRVRDSGLVINDKQLVTGTGTHGKTISC